MTPSPETRPRRTLSHLVAVLEGLISAFALCSVWGPAIPVLPTERNASPLQGAMRSGACLALGAPFFVLAARCAILVASGANPAVQQPSFGFSLPPGIDEYAVADLYLIGIAAGVLGVCVPVIEIIGGFLGNLLAGSPELLVVLALVLLAPGVYHGVGFVLEVLRPADGFVCTNGPAKGMVGLCSVGHLVLLCGCCFSPDLERVVGFVLGSVHTLRILKPTLSYRRGASSDEEAVGAVETPV